MTILLKYILKNIKEKKIRSSLIIISLTVSVVVLTFCLMLKDNILVKYEEFLRKNIGTADISISKEENIDILELNKLSNEKYISAPFLFYQDNKKYIYGANVEDFQKIKLLKSNLVTNLSDDETIISSKLAQKNNIKKGEKIELLGKEYKVVDIVEEYGFFIVNDKELEVYMLSINEVNRIINTNNYNLALDKERTYVNSAFIDVLDDDIENAKKDLHAIDENFDISVVKIDVEQAANEMNYLMFIMLVITTLISVYIINSILSLILQERMVVIGTFRSIGASKKMTNFILYLENSIYSIVSSIIGIIIGNSLIDKVTNIFISAGNIELTSKSGIKPIYILVVVLFTLFIQLFITFLQIRKNNKKCIKEIIFDKQESKYKLSKKKIIIGILFIIFCFVFYQKNTNYNFILGILPVVFIIVGFVMIMPIVIKIISIILSCIFKNISTMYLATKNVVSNKIVISNTILFFMILALSIFMLNISTSITNTYRAFDENSNYNIRLEVYGDEDKFSYLKDIEGVKQIGNYYLSFGNNKIDNKQKLLGFYGYDRNNDEILKLYNSIAFDKKLADSMKNDEIILDEAWAIKNGYKIGDDIKIEVQDVSDKEYIFNVIGFCDSTNTTASRFVAMITKDKYKQIYKHNYEILINSDLEDHIIMQNIENAIKENKDESYISATTYEEWISYDIESTNELMKVVYIIMMFAILLGMIGIINNGLIAFSQRKKGFAVLNSTCMSKKQLYKMLLEENIFSYFIAVIPAIALSYLLNIVITKTLSAIDIFINVVYDLKGAVVLISIVLVLIIIESLVPIINLKKMNIVKEIKYE